MNTFSIFVITLKINVMKTYNLFIFLSALLASYSNEEKMNHPKYGVMVSFCFRNSLILSS